MGEKKWYRPVFTLVVLGLEVDLHRRIADRTRHGRTRLREERFVCNGVTTLTCPSSCSRTTKMRTAKSLTSRWTVDGTYDFVPVENELRPVVVGGYQFRLHNSPRRIRPAPLYGHHQRARRP